MLRAFIDQIRLTFALLRDRRVPIWAKAIPILAIAYVLSPLDFIPDVIIGLGQLDDLAIIIGGMRVFESLVPQDVVDEHRAIIAGKPLDVIQGTGYKVTPDDKVNNQ